jgi:hypothetical protein
VKFISISPKAKPNKAFKIRKIFRQNGFLNVRSAVRSCPGSPALIKLTAAPNHGPISAQFPDISRRIPTLPECGVGKTRGQLSRHFESAKVGRDFSSSVSIQQNFMGDFMANRYTDTDKWEDDFFLGLPPKMKCAWQYLCDTVKGCGERKISLVKFSNDIGEPVSREEIDRYFAGRIYWLDAGTVWVPGTLSRIYRTLSPRIPAHINAAKKIVRMTDGLQLEGRGEKVRARFVEFLESLPEKVYSVPENTSSGPDEVKSGTDLKDKKRKEKREKKGGVGENKFDLAALYEKYPKKVGKTEGLRRLAAQIKTEQDYRDFETCVARYVADCGAKNRFLKDFDTFVSPNDKQSWRDCLDPEFGKIDVPAAKNWTAESAKVFDTVARIPAGNPDKLKEALGEELFNRAKAVGWPRIREMRRADVKTLGELLKSAEVATC